MRRSGRVGSSAVRLPALPPPEPPCRSASGSPQGLGCSGASRGLGPAAAAAAAAVPGALRRSRRPSGSRRFPPLTLRLPQPPPGDIPSFVRLSGSSSRSPSARRGCGPARMPSARQRRSHRPAQVDRRGEKRQRKAHEFTEREGEIPHPSPSRTQQTELGNISYLYYQRKQSRITRRKRPFNSTC